MNFLSLEDEALAEYSVKSSKFITLVAPIKGQVEAIEIIKKQKKTHSKATHNCSAWISYPPNEIKQFSDDGEPQGTAGKQILEVLQGARLKGVVAVVTRYFGGIKLGKGGLVQAYQEAIKGALDKAKIINLHLAIILTVKFSYSEYELFKKATEKRKIKVLDIQYTDLVTLKVACVEDEAQWFNKELHQIKQKESQINIIEKKFINYN